MGTEDSEHRAWWQSRYVALPMLLGGIALLVLSIGPPLSAATKSAPQIVVLDELIAHGGFFTVSAILLFILKEKALSLQIGNLDIKSIKLWQWMAFFAILAAALAPMFLLHAYLGKVGYRHFNAPEVQNGTWVRKDK